MSEIEPGTTMKDGTVYAGISPETGNMMFVTPKDNDLTMTFNDAATRVNSLNWVQSFGHDDWRFPTLKELDVIFENKDKGALKGTFNEAGVDYKDLKGNERHRNASGWYRTSVSGSSVTHWCQLFKTGDKAMVFNAGFASVRYIRDGKSPGPPPYKTAATTIARQDRLREPARRRRPEIKSA